MNDSLNRRTVETVADDLDAPSHVSKWLALDLMQVSENKGEELFRLGVPCRRREIRPAQTRYTFKNGGVAGDTDTGWDNHFDVGVVLEAVPQDEEMHREVVVPATYRYEAPEVFAYLTAKTARWCYENFEAEELIATFKLHGSKGWFEYVQELREKSRDTE